MRPARSRGFALVLCAMLLDIAGCRSGMSPTRIDVTGNWTGTWQFLTAGVTVTDAVTATLTQNGTSASGTWTAQSGASGQLTFPVAATISGTLTISQTTLTGQVCTATTTFAGTASATSLEFAAVSVTPTGVCQWATNNQFSLRK